MKDNKEKYIKNKIPQELDIINNKQDLEKYIHNITTEASLCYKKWQTERRDFRIEADKRDNELMNAINLITFSLDHLSLKLQKEWIKNMKDEIIK